MMTTAEVKRCIDQCIPVIYKGKEYKAIGIQYMRRNNEAIRSVWLSELEGRCNFTVKPEDLEKSEVMK